MAYQSLLEPLNLPKWQTSSKKPLLLILPIQVYQYRTKNSNIWGYGGQWYSNQHSVHEKKTRVWSGRCQHELSFVLFNLAILILDNMKSKGSSSLQYFDDIGCWKFLSFKKNFINLLWITHHAFPENLFIKTK